MTVSLQRSTKIVATLGPASGNPERMRRSFIRLLGTPPSALRMKRLPTSNRRASGL